jgi:hypothetical protein
LLTELTRAPRARRAVINRRAFLRAAGGVAIGLPFLEGLPERSAWSAGNPPVFGLFIVTACGVVPESTSPGVSYGFFPTATGALTTAGLSGMGDRATSVLAPYASNLLLLKGLNFPMTGPTSCGHAQGLCQTLTAAPAAGIGSTSYSMGMSADMVISQALNAGAADPLTLYAGNKKNGYIAERLSFQGAGPGQVRAADDNPYTLYSKLVGLLSPPPDTAATTALATEIFNSRKSVNDLVRAQLTSLINNPALSAADRQRLQQHFDAIRDVEVKLTAMASTCTQNGLAMDQINALQSGLVFTTDGMIEDIAKLHLELVALAFACNFNRVATLQHGDGTDQTRYSVPSNASLGWPFHHISHRVPSDSTVGSNPTAEQAHHEIDVVRLKTLLHGLEQFSARGLLDKSFIMWTSHIAEGPSHSFKNVPHIIAGSAGGYLKQGLFADAGGVTNNKLFNTLIAAAIRDKSTWTQDFGIGVGTGPLTAVMA